MRGNTTSEWLIIVFWVDDIILASSNMDMIHNMKESLSKRFKMDDRGELRWFLGIDIRRKSDGTVLMSQVRYISSILQRFGMTESRPISSPSEKALQLSKGTDEEHEAFKQLNFPYRQAIGSLIYLVMATRPDISWIVSKLSQFLDRPSVSHVTAFK